MITREDLREWSAEHNYPAIQFVGIQPVKLYPVPGLPRAVQPLKYAIGIGECKDNKMLWDVAIGTGSKDMIDGLLVYINSLKQEQLDAWKSTKTANKARTATSHGRRARFV